MLNPNARMIIIDASRYNFFPMIGLRSPLMPKIEWHKHQSPQTWMKLLEPIGFVKERVTWYQYHATRHLGPLVANRVVSFFLNSIFRLVVRYPGKLHHPLP